MPGSSIRQSMVLRVLTEQHDGRVLAGSNTDAAAKLLRTMTLRSGQRGTLCALLRQMAADDQVIIEVTGNHFDVIALPNITPKTEGEADMAAPRGMNMTIRARTANGEDLPSTLRDEHVGPVETTYLSPEAGENVKATADLVLERLGKLGKLRMGRDEVLGIIQGVVVELNEDVQSDVAATLVVPVFSYLVDQRRLLREPGGRQKVTVYLFKPPAEMPVVAQPPLTKDDAIGQLVAALEARDRTIAELSGALEEAKATRVDPAILEQLTERLETATTENEHLERQLGDAERTKRAHAEELKQLRAQHQAELRKLQEKLNASEVAKCQLETELAGRNQPVSVDLLRRMEKLGITLDR
jgi:hypothetical protein